MEQHVLPKDRPKCPGRELTNDPLITSPTPNQLSYFVPIVQALYLTLYWWPFMQRYKLPLEMVDLNYLH